jgi:hypothetical protein
VHSAIHHSCQGKVRLGSPSFDGLHSNTTLLAPSPAATSSEYTLSSPSCFVLSHQRTSPRLSEKSPPKSTAQANLPSPASPSPTSPGSASPSLLYLPAHGLTFIVGSSGSGKSTTPRLFLGMYQPQGGTVLLYDSELYLLVGFGGTCVELAGMGRGIGAEEYFGECCVGGGGCSGGDGRGCV